MAGMNLLQRRFGIIRIFTIALAGLAAALTWTGCASPQSKRPKKILVFTKSSNFEHDAIKRTGTNLSLGEETLKKIGETNNLEFDFTKDGRLITAENIAQYDGFVFYTTGDLTTSGTDHQPPMTREGKAAFLAAIRQGKGFVGIHSATDTFHSPGNRDGGAARFQNDGTNVDPYIAMIGGEFIIHASQQKARMIPEDPKFPGMQALPANFGPNEEWYTLKNFAPDLHVLLVQDTASMSKKTGGDYCYDRPPFPATWAHLYGKGRVFYTSMGHRDDIWKSPVFQQVLLGGINWAVRNVNADITPNLKRAAPEADQLPKYRKTD
jgi:type 1 glutamine amidotransferase